MSMTLRKQLALEQTDSRRLGEALLASLNGEVLWTDLAESGKQILQPSLLDTLKARHPTSPSIK